MGVGGGNRESRGGRAERTPRAGKGNAGEGSIQVGPSLVTGLTFAALNVDGM